ncbi:hypothetical protein NFI96_004207 [Prochilodus magdalenae]|nr:hypothetical protein NFI96_004207 [Prochilodus magdalenae]
MLFCVCVRVCVFLCCVFGWSSEPVTCSWKDFVCANGECISARFRCDGDFDCADHSDERGCESRCADGQYQCQNHLCISAKWLCDGQEDCKNGEDEQHCQPANTALIGGGCVSASLRCDGKSDCMDGSDERHLQEPEGTRGPGFWTGSGGSLMPPPPNRVLLPLKLRSSPES